MPIVGNLSEFPLPEVLLLIGQRTGRLRLLDIPEFGILDVDISNGSVQTMKMGSCVLTETREMVDKLGVIVQARSGMFEFQMGPVALMVNQRLVSIHDLAMLLVCHVDEQAAQNKAVPVAEQKHRLVVFEPEIWMEPELYQFFHAARSHLSAALPMGKLAREMGMASGIVHENLTKLRLLGIIEMVEAGEQTQTDAKIEIMDKASAYIRVAQMTDQFRKLSSKLPAV